MATRRRLLAFLTRAELLRLAADYEHSGLTAKPKDEVIDAIVGHSQPSKPQVLEYFSRNQLKAACEELGLDTTGREKQVLIDRLMGRDDEEDGPGTAGEEKPRTRSARPGELPIDDYRHEDVTRKNIPPAKLASEGKVPKVPPVQYAYSPRRPPVLRFDSTGAADEYFELLEQAKLRRLTEDEAHRLRDALSVHEPWLEWAGKQESDKRGTFDVDPVALHIHERVSAQAILKIAARQDVERTLFGDPEQAYHDAVQFYRHDMDWTNRLILGDSLQVMASLSHREDLAGKIQMIYMDPPYGIKFGSNFQPEIGRREVKDKEQDLTREPETVRAYRDTWSLGLHSYLSYLRARLVLARELLGDAGSLFVQIGDDNLHRVRCLLDSVFGPENLCGLIAFSKTSGLSQTLLPDRADYLLWYARNRESVKYRALFQEKSFEAGTASNYGWILLPDGQRRGQSSGEKRDPSLLPAGAIVYKADNITSQGNPLIPFDFQGSRYTQRWKTNLAGLERLALSERLHVAANSLQYVRRLSDFPVIPITKLWDDTATGSFTDEKMYAVQTGTKTIARCLLMTTDPGDLVLDPTCGSGTTAYVAEQWGRRWITIDTSRVAVAITRQRIMTANFQYYEIKSDRQGPSSGFNYKSVPHVTLKSIAQNPHLARIIHDV